MDPALDTACESDVPKYCKGIESGKGEVSDGHAFLEDVMLCVAIFSLISILKADIDHGKKMTRSDFIV